MINQEKEIFTNPTRKVEFFLRNRGMIRMRNNIAFKSALGGGEPILSQVSFRFRFRGAFDDSGSGAAGILLDKSDGGAVFESVCFKSNSG